MTLRLSFALCLPDLTSVSHDSGSYATKSLVGHIGDNHHAFLDNYLLLHLWLHKTLQIMYGQVFPKVKAPYCLSAFVVICFISSLGTFFKIWRLLCNFSHFIDAIKVPWEMRDNNASLHEYIRAATAAAGKFAFLKTFNLNSLWDNA